MTSTSQGEKQPVDDVAAHVNKAGAAAHDFIDEAKASGRSLLDAVDLQGRVEKNPYGMVAAALGVGYLVGGGLFTRTTARLFRIGIKLAAVPLVRDQLLVFAEDAIDGVLDRARKISRDDNEIPPASKE